MAGRVLLDTSAAAALLRGNQAVGEKLGASDEVYTSIVVVGELLYGARHSTNAASNLEQVAAFAAAIVVLPADQETAEVYARIKLGLRAKGRPIPDNDLWIAATAIQHDVALLNREHGACWAPRRQPRTLYEIEPGFGVGRSGCPTLLGPCTGITDSSG